MQAVRIGLAGMALALAPVPGAAQQEPITAGQQCFIQVPRLVAPPPGGIAALGEAIRSLDAALKPQVDEVNRLRSQVMQMQQRQQQAAQDPESTVDLVKLDEELRAASAELDQKQAALRASYSARQKEIVGPVQDKIGKVALAYSSEQGCGSVKMARASDMGGLAEANARDITDAFLAWYAAQAH